jgi:chromosomal replication initiation ATPase DnaA
MTEERIRQYRHHKPNICLNEIGSAVCTVFGLTEKELRDRKDANYIARAMCLYLATMKTKTTLRWYHEYFKGMRADEVLNTSNLMRQLVKKDKYLFNQMELIISKVG